MAGTGGQSIKAGEFAESRQFLFPLSIAFDFESRFEVLQIVLQFCRHGQRNQDRGGNGLWASVREPGGFDSRMAYRISIHERPPSVIETIRQHAPAGATLKESGLSVPFLKKSGRFCRSRLSQAVRIISVLELIIVKEVTPSLPPGHLSDQC